MASALLAGRSGAHHHWGETRAPLASVPPNSTPLPRVDGSTPRPQVVASPAPPPGYVAFQPAALPYREARALRDRLAGELGQVRALISRIDTWQQQQQRERQPKRDASPRRELPPAKLAAAMGKRCDQILTKLRRDKRSVWFNAPVDVELHGLHDYHTVIKSPMDLGTVKANLAAGRYPSHDAFAADVRLTFSNALRYNPAGHEVHTFAGDLLASFEKMYRAAVSWVEQERLRVEPPMPVPTELPLATAPAQVKVKPRAGNVRMRKPKAREPNKREMTLEEKNMLRLGLESLPEGKMHNVLQIVRKRNGSTELQGNEIELDIDEMDVETQWELDRFVNNFKKALNKSRRAAMVNGEIADGMNAAVANDNDVLMNGNVPTVVDNDDAGSENHVKRTTMAEQVDEYVDIEDEMPTATYQSVEIEKGGLVASGSGGSGTGSSSSSGSDSGSSRDSVSEAGNARSLV